MSKEANPAVIGGFVLGALALLVGALIVFGGGALLRQRIELVTFFPGSVQGLNNGAQVQFQGVPIGQVTSIALDYLPSSKNFRVPVRYEIWPRQVNIMGGFPTDDAEAVIRRLVEEQGLRARLESLSLVTGQYAVSLSLNPHLHLNAHPPDVRGAIQIPALEATRDRIEDLLSNLPLNDLVGQATGTLDAIHALFSSGKIDQAVTELTQTLSEARTLLTTLNQKIEPLSQQAETLLTRYSELADSTRERIDAMSPAIEQAATAAAQLTSQLEKDLPPLVSSAETVLSQGARTLADIDRLIASDSPTRYQFEQLLRETTQAARSVRILASYLERHPEALLSGKHPSGAR